MAEYRTTIRSDRVDLDLNTTSYQLSLSRVGAQGSAGQDAEDLRLTIHDINRTYTAEELVLESANQGARLYRAIQNVPVAIALTNTTYWQAVGEDNLTFNDTDRIDITRNADGSISADIVAGSIRATQLNTTGVTAGTYSNATLTVDAQGRLSAASSGASGGGGSQIPSEQASLSLSVSERAQGSAAVTVTGTLSVNSRYTFVGTGANNGSAGAETVHVQDGDGNAIAVTKANLSDTTFTFVLSAAEQTSPQTIRAYATITATYSGTNYSATVSDDIVIFPQWYSSQGTSQPVTLTGMTPQGRLLNPEVHTFTKTGSADNTLYLALPEVSGRTYEFRSGLVFLSTTRSSTTINSGTHRIYTIDDFAGGALGGTLVVRISH